MQPALLLSNQGKGCMFAKKRYLLLKARELLDVENLESIT
jgi:hypothetical protein